MVKKPKADEGVEVQAVTPDQLTFRCIELCPELIVTQLPTPWPPPPQAPLAAPTSSKR